MRFTQREKFLAAAVVVLFLCIMGRQTLAYFTAEDTARNVITTSGVAIEIVERQETDAGLVAYPDEELPIMPGDSVSKIVTVENQEAASWIRARIHVRILNSQGKEMELTAQELAGIVQLAGQDEAWQPRQNADGWLYYSAAVQPGEETEPILTQVTFDGPNMSNAYQSCRVEIDVIAQAVQAANNGTGALNAAGWSDN